MFRVLDTTIRNKDNLKICRPCDACGRDDQEGLWIELTDGRLYICKGCLIMATPFDIDNPHFNFI
jgi:hypothetical protein